jgi:hypothetical protein
MYCVISTLKIFHRKNCNREGAYRLQTQVLIFGGKYCIVLLAQLYKYDKTLSFMAHRNGSSKVGGGGVNTSLHGLRVKVELRTLEGV